MSGFTNDVMNASNVDFSGGHPVTAQITQDGQLMIGSTASPNIRPGFLTSNDGTVTVTNSSGGIDLSASVESFRPNAVIHEFDDFINGSVGGGFGSKLGWSATGNVNILSGVGTSTNPGIAVVSSGVVPSLNIGLFIYEIGVSNIGPFTFGGGVFNANWVVKLTSLSSGGDTYRFSCGFADPLTMYNATQGGGDNFIDGVYFQYTDGANSGNWTLNGTASSVTTTTNTSTAATTSFVNLGISINAAGTVATFTINGSTVGTVASNVPTANLTPFFLANNLSGTTPDMQIDLWYMTNTLTTPR